MRNLYYLQKVIGKERRQTHFTLLDNISSGGYHVLALIDGAIYSWGRNNRGQLGVTTLTQSDTPTYIGDRGSLNGKHIVKVCAGFQHSLAIDSEGAIHAWGDNDGRQLGTGATSSFTNTPALVTTSGVLNDKHIIDLAGGMYHTVCLDSSGKCYAWGDNSYGEVGDNSTTLRATPVEVHSTGVLSGKNIKKVTSGLSHCVVLDSNGNIYSWGRSFSGALGNGSTTSSSVPVAVDLGSRVATCMDTGAHHSLICASDGNLMAWGNNDYYQIGLGGTAPQLTPALVTQLGELSPATVRLVFTGGFFSGAITASGRVYSIGHNSLGQLGVGDTDSRAVYTRVEGLIEDLNINYVSGGYYFTSAIDNNENIYTWGENIYGQLGNDRVPPTESRSTVPVAI